MKYLCDKKCRKKNNYSSCKNRRKIRDTKRIILFYHFKYNKYQYTFIKLEKHFSLSLKHGKEAFKRYKLKKDKNTFYKLSRREDCFKNKNCSLKKTDNTPYNSLNEYHILNYIKNNPNKKTKIEKSVNFYSKNLRTGDEMFIPEEITMYILEQFKNK